MKEMKYQNLFAPLQINGVMLKNRIIAAPMGVPKAMLVSSTYYGGISLPDKARGGSGAVVVSSYGTADIANPLYGISVMMNMGAVWKIELVLPEKR